MKRFRLICTAILLVLGLEVAAQDAENLSDLAIPLGVNFGADDLVDEVIVTVLRGYTETPFAVYIEITSINGVFHDQGKAVISLSDATVLDEAQRAATVSFGWSEPGFPSKVGDTYTICATLVWPNPDKTGETRCEAQDAN